MLVSYAKIIANSKMLEKLGLKLAFGRKVGLWHLWIENPNDDLVKHAAILSLVPLGKHTYEESIP